MTKSLCIDIDKFNSRVRNLPPRAQYVWLRLKIMMAASRQVGYMPTNDDNIIALECGVDADEYKVIIRLLLSKSIFKVNGVIYDPEIVDDIKQIEKKESEKYLLEKFEQAWEIYPRKMGKKAAFRHFKASIKNEDDFGLLLAALGNYKKYLVLNQIEAKYIQNGSTWFNNWRDYVNYKPHEDFQKRKDADDLYRMRKSQGRCTTCGTKLRIENGLKICPSCEPVNNSNMSALNGLFSSLGVSKRF